MTLPSAGETPNAVVSLTSNGAFADSLFCGHLLGNASLIDVETLRTVRSFSPPRGDAQSEWSRDAVHSLALHPSQPLLAVGTRYGFVHLFDVRDPACCVSIRAHSDSVAQVAFHPWFSTLLSSGYDGALRVWCDRERSLVRQYTVPMGARGEAQNIDAPVFNESALRFAVSSSTGNLVVGGATGALHCFV